jgi:hypothetical protein
MTVFYPIALEDKANGAVSAYVPGLPVYAAAEPSVRSPLARSADLVPGRRGAWLRIGSIDGVGSQSQSSESTTVMDFAYCALAGTPFRCASNHRTASPM